MGHYFCLFQLTLTKRNPETFLRFHFLDEEIIHMINNNKNELTSSADGLNVQKNNPRNRKHQ